MPLKAGGAATDPAVIDRWDGGAGWIAHPGETIRRASHALVGEEGGVWLVDSVDAPVVDDLLAELGDPAGVVVLLDRHQRDADAVARRHDVPVYLPPYVDREFRAPVERFEDRLGASGFRHRRTVDLPLWREGALFDGETLVVADALGTAEHYLAPGERLGVQAFLRLRPPRAFDDLTPDRVLVGHGEGVLEEGTAALRDALRGARRNLPAAWLRAARAFLPP